MNIRYYRPETKSSKNTAIAEIFNFVTFAAVTFPAPLPKRYEKREGFYENLLPFFFLSFLISLSFLIHIKGIRKNAERNPFSKIKKVKKSAFFKNK